MARWERWLRHAAVVLCGLAVSACGGGSNGGTETAAPQITGQPAGLTVVDGATAQFSVVATGSGSLSYQWRKNNQAINGATSASLSFPANHASDNGASYTVVVSNGGGNTTSSAVTLTVTPVAASIATQPADALVEAGLSAAFSVQVDAGTQPLSYQWQRDGVDIAGATAASYTLPTTTLGDSGAQFGVVVSNAAGATSSSAAVLTVSSTPLPPTISSQPQATTVDAGGVASFSVTASGSGVLTYQWQRDGSPIAGATSASYTTPATTANDEGAVYSVLVSNAAGSSISAAATLHVNSAPIISTQPQAVALYVGQTATFSVVARGTAPLNYQWQRNGTAIAGATAASYSLSSLALGDSGASFAVVVTNALGSVTSTAAVLTVSAAPAGPLIVTQPLDVSLLAGKAASFSVVANSSTPVSYQWRRNGAAIAGATASGYTTDTLAYTDSGALYSVVITNAAGSVTSRSATLTVNPRVVQVGAGGYLASARKEDGTVWNWGYSFYLGTGTTVAYGTMARAMNTDGTLFNGITSFSTGYGHTLAVKSDGSVWAWGDNTEGSIGDGRRGTGVDAYYPVKVADSAGTALAGVARVSGGWRYSLALKTDGTVWAWGYALQGRLGNDNTSGVRSFPNPVAVLDNTGAPLAGITQVEGGNDHSVALKSDGTVWIWGNGQAGRLGDGQRNVVATTAKRLNDSTGVAISGVVQVSAGDDHSILVKSDGTAYAWGVNSRGQLSDGTTTERDWATLVKDASGNAFTGIAAAYAGNGCTVFLKTDGTVWMVGENRYGELGNGSTVSFVTSPVQVTFSDGTELTGVTQVALFDSTVVVLRSDSTVWAWGGDQSGELGIAPTNQVQFYRYPQKVSVSGDQ